MFITQSPGDIVEAGIARVLTEMCPNQIHGFNPRARRDDYVKGLSLSDGQYEAIRAIEPGNGMFLFVQGTKAVLAAMPMRDMADYVRILSASEEDLTAADNVVALPERSAA